MSGTTNNHVRVINHNQHLKAKAQLHPNEKAVRLPGWLLDKMAEEKHDQGWSSGVGGTQLRRSNMCGTCFQYKARNGECGCEE